MSKKARDAAQLLRCPFVVGDRVVLRTAHGTCWSGRVCGLRERKGVNVYVEVYVQWDGIDRGFWYDHQLLKPEGAP